MNPHWRIIAAGSIAIISVSFLLWNFPLEDEYSLDCLLWQSGESSDIRAMHTGFDDAKPLSQTSSLALNQSRHQYTLSTPDPWEEYLWNFDYEDWLYCPCLSTYWHILDQGEERIFVRFQDGTAPRPASSEPEFWIAGGLVLDPQNKKIVGLALTDMYSKRHKIAYTE